MRTVLLSGALLVSGMAGTFSFLVARDLRATHAEMASLTEEVARLTHLQETSRANVVTDFNGDEDAPRLDASTWVDPLASVIGAVEVGRRVYVGPFASVRGDEGQPIHIGDDANIQDGVVIHALETESHGQPVEGRTYVVGGRQYAVFVGDRVSLAHQALVHGPARVDEGVFVGMQAMVFKASVGAGSVVEPGAKVIGVAVPPGRYVPAGMVVTTQAAADALPVIEEGYPFRTLNDAVVHVNTSLAGGYGARATGAGTPAAPHGDATADAHGEAAVVKEAAVAH